MEIKVQVHFELQVQLDPGTLSLDGTFLSISSVAALLQVGSLLRPAHHMAPGITRPLLDHSEPSLYRGPLSPTGDSENSQIECLERDILWDIWSTPNQAAGQGAVWLAWVLTHPWSPVTQEDWGGGGSFPQRNSGAGARGRWSGHAQSGWETPMILSSLCSRDLVCSRHAHSVSACCMPSVIQQQTK